MQKTTKRHLDIIGYDSGWGCTDWGCEDGPYRLNAKRIAAKLAKHGHRLSFTGALGLKMIAKRKDFKRKEDTLPFVVEGVKRISEHIRKQIKKDILPIVIGGDHASAIGTWAGVTSALKMQKKFGLIWLDAHLDAHTPKTAHEGKWGGWWHGMPVACICGFGEKTLTSIGGKTAKISPKHLSMIGIRSFEPGEQKFTSRHKIKTYFMEDIDARGFQKIFLESLKRANTGTKGFGLSIDLDAFDPKDAPGVGTAEDGGLRAKDVIAALKGVGLHPKFKGLEIAEYNPHNDRGGKTLKLIENIIISVFSRT